MYNVRNAIFKKKNILKRNAVSITENLTKKKIIEMKYVGETFGFKSVWSKDNEILYIDVNDRSNDAFEGFDSLILPCFKGSFMNCMAMGRKHLRSPFLKVFIDQIILLIVFPQNSNALKLCSVASDEPFVSFLYINEL